VRFAPISLACGAVAVAALTAPAARANGRFPTAQQLAPSPTDPNFLSLMATFGVVVSKDTGRNWDWVCELAVGYEPSENPTLGVTANNNVLISTFEGLGVTTDRGCNWTIGVGGLTDVAVDLVVEPADRHSALVLTSKYLSSDAGTPTYNTRIWVTHDDGATFAQVGTSLDPAIISETIDVAPSDSTRIYVSGTRRTAGVAYGVLLRSSDGGQTFAETDFPLVTGDAGLIDRAPFIAAVDPKNPDRVYVRVDNIDGTRLLVSDDGLASTRQVWQAKGQLTGFAVSADGAKVYAGGSADGLYVTSSSALSFATQKWPGQLGCLAIDPFVPGRLLACSNEVSGFAVGASTDDGATWTPLLHLGCVRGPLACDPSSPVTTQCAPGWATQQQALGGVCLANTDAGSATDAGSGGSDAGTAPTPPATARGGCSAAPPAAGAGRAILALGLAVAAFAGFVRRRRRRAD
jgi:MYXO-CTERM domain-containing protein